MYGYIKGQRVELDFNEPVEIFMERGADDNRLFPLGFPRVLAHFLISQDGKRINGQLVARSAGASGGVHVGVQVQNAKREAKKEVHALPWR